MTPLDAMPVVGPKTLALDAPTRSDDGAIKDNGLVLDLDRLAGREPKVLVPGAPTDPTTLLGYGKHTPDDDDAPMRFQAPVSRSGGFGGDSSLPRRVTLSPDQLALARSLKLSPQEFAQQVLELARRKKLDPERYSGRG
jgi:hypothetical protein